MSLKGCDNMAMSEARKRANAKWNAKAYSQLNFRVKKGEDVRLKLYCLQHDTSLNGFVTAAVAYCIANDVDLSDVPALDDVLPEGDGFPSDTV